MSRFPLSPKDDSPHRRFLWSYDFVIATKFTNPPNSLFRGNLNYQKFNSISEESNFAFTVHPDAFIVEKTGYGFKVDDLLVWLKENGITEVDICGVDTEGCVLACTITLFDEGINPIVLKDLCASTGGRSYHQAGLMILERLIGKNNIVVRKWK